MSVKSTMDLALKTFGASDGERVKETEGGSHEERHAYYRDLSAKEQAGKKLDDDERAWLAQARQAMRVRETGDAKAVKPSIDDMAIQEMSKPGVLAIGNKTAFDPRGVMPEQKIENYDPLTPKGSAKELYGNLRKSQDPAFQAFAQGFGASMNAQRPQRQALIPLGGQSGLGTPVAQDEMGRPVYESNVKPAKRHVVIPRDEMYGYDEKDGQVIDGYGKKLGYEDTAPYRTLDRRPSDVRVVDEDEFGDNTLKKTYQKHLDAVDENNGKYPADYFKGMSPEEKDGIKKGVEELIRRRRGIRT